MDRAFPPSLFKPHLQTFLRQYLNFSSKGTFPGGETSQIEPRTREQNFFSPGISRRVFFFPLAAGVQPALAPPHGRSLSPPIALDTQERSKNFSCLLKISVRPLRSGLLSAVPKGVLLPCFLWFIIRHSIGACFFGDLLYPFLPSAVHGPLTCGRPWN